MLDVTTRRLDAAQAAAAVPALAAVLVDCVDSRAAAAPSSLAREWTIVCREGKLHLRRSPLRRRPMSRACIAALLASSILATACARRPASAVAPIPSPTAAPSSSAPLVIGETFTIESPTLRETRRINVYVPPDYRASADVRLPVLYMPDGGMAEDFLHVAGLVQVSVGNGTMRPFILVGIENTERRRDMTGPTEVAEDRRIAPRVGGSAAFRTFVRAELMPEVERRYRTTRERAIVGESLAGLFVVETFLLEPDLFDHYLAFDPSLWWDDGRLVREAGTRVRAHPEGTRSLWMASSEEREITTLTRALADTLTRAAPRGLAWRLEPMPEEKHSTIFHPGALKAFRALFAPPPAPAR